MHAKLLIPPPAESPQDGACAKGGSARKGVGCLEHALGQLLDMSWAVMRCNHWWFRHDAAVRLQRERKVGICPFGVRKRAPQRGLYFAKFGTQHSDAAHGMAGCGCHRLYSIAWVLGYVVRHDGIRFSSWQPCRKWRVDLRTCRDQRSARTHSMEHTQSSAAGFVASSEYLCA